MYEKIILAIIVAISAMIGSAISGVISPWVKHRLEQEVKESTRKREQIQKWRAMILHVAEKCEHGADPRQILQTHPDYLSLEPLLDEEAKKAVYAPSRMHIAGVFIPTALYELKINIDDIEKKWGLN